MYKRIRKGFVKILMRISLGLKLVVFSDLDNFISSRVEKKCELEIRIGTCLYVFKDAILCKKFNLERIK